jgi:hypothetical protein
MAGSYVTENTVTGTTLDGLALPISNNPGSYWAGLLNITVGATPSGGASFDAFCIDPAQYANNGLGDYSVSSGLGSFTNATWISNLYSNSFSTSTGDANRAAAFQLALWELAAGTGDLSGLPVQISAATNPTVVGYAQDMITSAKAGPGSAQYSFSLYASATAQDYLVANVIAVPEPETYAMLLAGLGLMGFTVRRRRASN